MEDWVAHIFAPDPFKLGFILGFFFFYCFGTTIKENLTHKNKIKNMNQAAFYFLFLKYFC